MAVFGVLVTVLFAVSVQVCVHPSMSAPRRADVLMVLGPPDPWRIAWARDLVAAGDAGAVLLSTDDPAGLAACTERWPVEVFCFRPDPFTTRGEASYLQRAMAEHGWATALVVTATSHVARARFVIGRCVRGGVQVVGRAPGWGLRSWTLQYVRQTAGWARALTQLGC